MNETAAQIRDRFEHLYIGDSVIERLIVDFQKMQCSFRLSFGRILKDTSNPDIFDPAQRYEPAALVFDGVRSISCPEGDFFLNATIVDFEATEEQGDLIKFRLEMTGGLDNESFMRSLVILAETFSLGSAD